MRHFSTKGTSALISGNYYNDCIVYCDNDYNYEALNDSTAVYWPVFMWHKRGSLNNDVSRDNRSANLKTKIISNYRRCDTTIYTQDIIKPTFDIRVFNGTESSSLIKLNNKYIYKGCIEDALRPKRSSFYFVGEPLREVFKTTPWQPTQYSLPIMKIYQKDKDNVDNDNWTYIAQFKDDQDSDWYATTVPKSDDFYRIEWDSLGNDYDDLGKQNKNLSYFEEDVLIKYKSSPHMVINLQRSDYPNEALCDWSLDGSGFPFKKVTGDFGFTTIINSQVHPYGALPLAEIRRPYNSATFFGGTSDDAFQNITWIPCGPSIRIRGNTDIKIPYKWGDSYYQRFECLKTYPYTEDDLNQVVEVGSFYLESRVNLDGRYDNKIGDTNALYTRPTNFNLINSVYSQQDNIFSGKILPDTYHKTNIYNNQIVWTETKEEAGDTDLWTSISMNSVLSLDGSCGKINKIAKHNNTLYVFQDAGIAQILYNESTQLSTTAGVPVEIANSGKVNGVRYISSVIGCSDKSLITVTPNGIYFVDSISKSIYLLNEQGLTNISNKFGFTTWCYNNFPNLGSTWNSNFSKDTDNDTIHKDTVLYYDKINQEVLFINKKTALVFSEKVGAFTSFYDYGNTPYFCNLEDTGLWIKPDSTLWKHQAGEYCNFFGEKKPYGMILVGNPEPQADKMFTNLEFRAYADEDDVTPFDSLTTWNEYQEGKYTFTNNTKNASFLSKKFRMWRCNIPRDSKHIMDRMRGPWLYLKLEKDTDTSSRVEIHDIAMTYYK